MGDKHFVVMITCVDGEIQEVATAWAQQFFAAQYVDLVTEFGPEKILTDATAPLGSMRANVQHAVDTHHCLELALVGHSPCTGNAVAADVQRRQIRQGVDLLASWGMLPHIVGAFVNALGQVEMVHEWKQALTSTR